MPAQADIQHLLTHAEWLRGLARHLVRDDADAADAVQQTWAAALKSPPDPARPARPWLAQVLRNFVRKDARAARNRGARELAVGSPDAAAPSSEALLESVQLQRLLGELVVALEEPYRSAILLRYYEGLEPARIAEAQGVPAGTVRWRVSEGIARLRAALAKRLGGEREWRLALLPLVSEPPASTGKGVIVAMSAKTKVALVVAVAGVSVAGGRLAWQSLRPAGSGDRSAVASGASTSPERAAAMAAAPARSDPGGSSAEASPAAGQGAPATGLIRKKTPPPRFVATPPPPASASPQTGGTHGSMRKEDIQAGVKAAMPAMKACYARLLQESPGISGQIVINFTLVDKDGVGRVSDATIGQLRRPSKNPELAAPLTQACMLQALAAQEFAAPVGGPVSVSYPILFAPKPPEEAR